MKHSRFRDKVVTILRELNASWIFCPRDRFRKGIPDILCLIDGLFLAIEIKIDKDTIKPLQLKNLRKISRGNGCGLVIKYCKGKVIIDIINGG